MLENNRLCDVFPKSKKQYYKQFNHISALPELRIHANVSNSMQIKFRFFVHRNTPKTKNSHRFLLVVFHTTSTRVREGKTVVRHGMFCVLKINLHFETGERRASIWKKGQSSQNRICHNMMLSSSYSSSFSSFSCFSQRTQFTCY